MGDPFGFFNIHCCQILKKIEGRPFGFKKFSKKVLTMPKKRKGGPFSLSRYCVCMLRGKRKKVWFSSLRQMIQFGTIKVRRSFKNYLGQLVWIEKRSHYNNRVSLHEAPTKKTFKNFLTQ